MLLASMAHILARSGKSVFALDLDFEAPGLHYKLSPGGPADLPRKGAINFISETLRTGAPPKRLWGEYVFKVNETQPNLRLMAAGSPFTGEYLDLLGGFDVRNMFDGEENAGIDVFSLLKASIQAEFEPDYLLIDARTGLTHVSSVALQLLTDAAICLFSCSSESYDGSLGVMRSVAFGNDSQDIPTEIFPVISRVSTSRDGAKLEKEFRQRLRRDLPNVEESKVLVLHTDVSFEVDDRPAINQQRSLAESTLMNDMVGAAKTLFGQDRGVMEVLDQLNLPENLQEGGELQPPMPILDRMSLRSTRKGPQQHLIVANKRYVEGRAYNAWVDDLLWMLLNRSKESGFGYTTVPSADVIWARVPEQMRSGAFDFCCDPYYIQRSRELLLGYFPFGYVSTFELFVEAGTEFDDVLTRAYNRRDHYKKWTLRDALIALFRSGIQIKGVPFNARHLQTVKDTSSSTECQRIMAELLLDDSVHLVGQKEKPEDLKNSVLRDFLLVIDHGTGVDLLKSLPSGREYARQQGYRQVYYENGPVPVGLIYPKEDTQWGRAIADAVSNLIRTGQLTESYWEAVSDDLREVGIGAVSFDTLQRIASRGMSFAKAFDWGLARSDAVSRRLHEM